MVVLPTAYFGPISWYRQLNSADTCLIDATDRFRKRTFRNRCDIATPNGRQTLTVPVEHQPATTITTLRISEHNKWRHQHWNALEAAYGNSPFFDYYADDLRPFFLPDWEYLFDLNLAITRKMCELLQIETVVISGSEEHLSGSEDTVSRYEVRGTRCENTGQAQNVEVRGARYEVREYRASANNCAVNYSRSSLPAPRSSKKDDSRSSLLAPRSSKEESCYYQPYASRYGFLPDLSILDLLFNMGNESILYL